MTVTAVAAADPTPPMGVIIRQGCFESYSTLELLGALGLREGRDFGVLDITSAPDSSMAFVMKLCGIRAPLVAFGGESWAGFKPDQLRAAAAQVLAERYGGAA